MAWTDAARAAAAAARKLHAQAQRSVGDRLPIAPAHLARRQIAIDVKAIRSGTSSMGRMGKEAVMETARLSTNMRNYIRKGLK